MWNTVLFCLHVARSFALMSYSDSFSTNRIVLTDSTVLARNLLVFGKYFTFHLLLWVCLLSVQSSKCFVCVCACHWNKFYTFCANNVLNVSMFVLKLFSLIHNSLQLLLWTHSNNVLCIYYLPIIKNHVHEIAMLNMA